MERQLKRKRSASPPAAPRAADGDDYREGDGNVDTDGEDPVDLDLADRMVLAKIDGDWHWPCRVCGAKMAWLRFVGGFPQVAWA